MADEARTISEVQDARPQGLGCQHFLAQAKRSNEDKESTIVAFESPFLAFIGLCGNDLPPLTYRLFFDIRFHRDGLQVGDLFRDEHRPGHSTITGLDFFNVFDPLVVFVYHASSI